jgi:PilZ domain
MADAQQPDERRRFRRILFDAPVGLFVGGAEHPTTLIDISLKGALIQAPSPWPADLAPGAPAVLHIALDPGGSHIEMHGHLVHREAAQAGFLCDHIDMDSITHLRRLVELNLGDAALLERELTALRGEQ